MMIFPYSFDFFHEISCRTCNKAFFIDLRAKGASLMKIGIVCPYCDEHFRPSQVMKMLRDARAEGDEKSLVFS